MSVCQTITFERLNVDSCTSDVSPGIRYSSSYEGHWVKVNWSHEQKGRL